MTPFQIHALTEIIGALTVSSAAPTSPVVHDPSPAPRLGLTHAVLPPQQQLQLERRRLEEQRNLNLESALVQRSIMLQQQGGTAIGLLYVY